MNQTRAPVKINKGCATGGERTDPKQGLTAPIPDTAHHDVYTRFGGRIAGCGQMHPVGHKECPRVHRGRFLSVHQHRARLPGAKKPVAARRICATSGTPIETSTSFGSAAWARPSTVTPPAPSPPKANSATVRCPPLTAVTTNCCPSMNGDLESKPERPDEVHREAHWRKGSMPVERGCVQTAWTATHVPRMAMHSF